MRKNMKIVCAGVACGFLACAMTAMAAPLEQYAFTNGVDGTAIANTWGGWSVTNGPDGSGSAIFTSTTFQVYGTTYTGRIVAKLQNSSIGHDFTNTLDQQTNIWVSMRISPVLNDTVPTDTEITNAAAVFWFGSDSNIYYYNGTGLTSNNFSAVVTNGAWYVVTAHLDYTNHTYDLFINSTDDGNRSVSNIGFYTPSATAFSNVTVIEKSTDTNSYVDYIGGAITTNTALAAQIYMRAYMTAEGVVIEFRTVEERYAGEEMVVRRADGTVVGTVISQGLNGSYTYRLIDSRATAGGSYNYTVVDDESITRNAQVTVGDALSSMVEMTATSITLHWKGQQGLKYDIFKAVSLTDGFTKVNSEPILAVDFTMMSYVVPIDNGETRAFFKIQALSPNP